MRERRTHLGYLEGNILASVSVLTQSVDSLIGQKLLSILWSKAREIRKLLGSYSSVSGSRAFKSGSSSAGSVVGSLFTGASTASGQPYLSMMKRSAEGRATEQERLTLRLSDSMQNLRLQRVA